MSRQISFAATSFPALTLKERVDILPGQLFAQQLRIDPTISDIPGASNHTPAGIDRYLKRAQSGGFVAVEYTDPGIGRLSVQVVGLKKDETSITQTQPGDGGNPFKATICNRWYQDVDMVNAHPVLLLQLCQHQGIEMPMLQQYIADRDSLIASTGLPKWVFKKLVFSTVMYNLSDLTVAQLEAKAIEAGAPCMPPLLLQMRTELLAAVDRLLEAHPEYYEHAVLKKKDKGGLEYFNLKGTALAYIVQTAEKKALMGLYKYFQKAGVTVGALVYDGLHAEMSGPHPIHLTEAPKFIKKETGFDVTLSYKPWDVPACMEEAIIAPDTVAQAEMVLKTLGNRVLRCDGRLWFCDDTKRWISGDAEIDRLVTNHVGTLTICSQTATGLTCVSRQATTMIQISKQVQRTFPDDQNFLKRMYEQTMGQLAFEDGYYCFKTRTFVPEAVEHMTRVPSKFPHDSFNDRCEVQTKLLEPILGDIQPAFLNYLARGLAGCVDDKSWAAGLGERASGKSVICMLAELAFGREIVHTINSESFLCGRGDSDAAKSLGFLIPAEWARLVITNECEIKGVTLNGAAIKKFSSGGDTISARLLHKNAASFRIQSRLLMCANDLPEVAPADAKSTALLFQFPSCFVDKTDGRLGTHPMYREGNDSIKTLIRKERIQAAFIHILLESYGPPVISDTMKVMQDEFRSNDDRIKFLEMFAMTKSDNDVLAVSAVADKVRHAGLPVTALAYNRWLDAAGAKRGREMYQGKRQCVVKRIKINTDYTKPD